MKNFNEIFKNDVTYDNIKSQQKPWDSEDTFFEKPQGNGGQTDPPPPLAVSALNSLSTDYQIRVLSQFFVLFLEYRKIYNCF